MNISPPITIDTSASDRASGPVNVSARLIAARSQGDCASATVGTNNRIATAKSVDLARKQLPHIGSSIVSVAFAVEQMVDGPSKTNSKIDGGRSTRGSMKGRPVFGLTVQRQSMSVFTDGAW